MVSRLQKCLLTSIKLSRFYAFSFWEGVRKYHQILRGTLDTKKVKNAWDKQRNDAQVDHLKSTGNYTICNGKKVHFGLFSVKWNSNFMCNVVEGQPSLS